MLYFGCPFLSDFMNSATAMTYSESAAAPTTLAIGQKLLQINQILSGLFFLIISREARAERVGGWRRTDLLVGLRVTRPQRLISSTQRSAWECVGWSAGRCLPRISRTRADRSKGEKRKRRRCVPGLIISTDARREANDKTHAIYPLMRAEPVFASVDVG